MVPPFAAARDCGITADLIPGCVGTKHGWPCLFTGHLKYSSCSPSSSQCQCRPFSRHSSSGLIPACQRLLPRLSPSSCICWPQCSSSLLLWKGRRRHSSMDTNFSRQARLQHKWPSHHIHQDRLRICLQVRLLKVSCMAMLLPGKANPSEGQCWAHLPQALSKVGCLPFEISPICTPSVWNCLG